MKRYIELFRFPNVWVLVLSAFPARVAYGMVGLGIFFKVEQELNSVALAGLAVVISGTSGDLIESAIKRDLAIKDMGDLLPGHGGVLDRIDSILYAAPTLWLALELVRRAQDSGLL